MFEEYELPIVLDDLPNYILRNSNENDCLMTYNDQNKANIARKYLLDLQLCLLSKDEKTQSELFSLYDLAFNKISQTHFKQAEWPNVEDIEKLTNTETTIDISVEYLYQELCFRHVFARMTVIPTKARIDSWENYKSLFQDFAHPSNSMLLPPAWIWDILDEFIYQFTANLQWKSRNEIACAEVEKELKDNKDTFWNLDEIVKLLENLVSKSKIMEGDKIKNFELPISTIQYFGYYSLVTLLRLHTLVCNYEKALTITRKFNFEHLNIFSKAYGSFMTLFYYSGVSYFMKKQYKRSFLVLEALVKHINQYKQFFSKSFQYEHIIKNYEKAIHLIALVQIFSNTKLDETMLNLIQGKLGDRIEKLKRFDMQTFNECFSFGVPRFITKVDETSSSAKENFDHIGDTKEDLAQDFLKIQKFSDFNSLLKLYSKISLAKAAKYMGVSLPDLDILISQFNEKSRCVIDDSQFESTIIQKLIRPFSQISFQIKDGEIIVEDFKELDYNEIILEQNVKIEQLLKKLESV